VGGIFISHSHADKPLVDRFVASILRLGSGVSEDDIFYSSGDDTGVPSGRDLNAFVRERVAGAELVIAIVTPSYLTSHYCSAELGAAWSRVGDLFPLALPDITPQDLEGGVLSGMTVRSLSNSGALDELHDRVTDLRDTKTKTATWTQHKHAWLRDLESLVAGSGSATVTRDPSERHDDPALRRQVYELTEAGILRVYRDREPNEDNADNADTRLRREFLTHDEGPVLILGVTLRVFFGPMGPFSHAINAMLTAHGDGVSIKALLCDPSSPEVRERANIEQRARDPRSPPQIMRDIDSTLATVHVMVKERRRQVEVRQFRPAPYCTAVVFPHIAYFSPNILAPEVPVRLPMILFSSESHGYRMLAESFDFLWTHPDTAVPEMLRG